LQRVDLITAERLNPNDQQRISRAVEVFRVSGKPLSSFHTSNTQHADKPSRPLPPLISVEPSDRAWLHQRIENRFMLMLEQGLVTEVRNLGNRGDLTADMPSMRCVGYRQTWECLVEDDLFTLPERGMAATRQLAKRQITWLRSMPQRQVVACDAADATAQVTALASRIVAEHFKSAH